MIDLVSFEQEEIKSRDSAMIRINLATDGAFEQRSPTFSSFWTISFHLRPVGSKLLGL